MFWKKILVNKGLAKEQCHYQFLHWAQVNACQKMGYLPHFLYWASLSISIFEGMVPYEEGKKNGKILLTSPAYQSIIKRSYEPKV